MKWPATWTPETAPPLGGRRLAFHLCKYSMETTEITKFQFFECSKRQTDAYDEQDLIDACNDKQEDILIALALGDIAKVGRILATERQFTIERRINIELFGRIK